MRQEITDQREWLDRLEIGVVDGSETEEILGVLSRGMCNDPLHVAAFVRKADFSHALVARNEIGSIVGLCGMSPPGERVPSLRQEPYLHDRHWQLGPLVVDTNAQGIGVEDRLMCVSCARIDAARGDAFLETDKPENVRFYERFGFEVAGEKEVHGMIVYFMIRRTERRKYQPEAERIVAPAPEYARDTAPE